MRSPASLVAVEIDEAFDSPHPLIAAERAAAMRDLAAGTGLFRPAGRDRGVFRLRLAIDGGKLVLAVGDRQAAPVAAHILSLAPLKRVIKDYFLICESFRDAVASAPGARIEAVDMARRGLHDEGAAIVRARLVGKIEIDGETARRLFTLICALSWKG